MYVRAGPGTATHRHRRGMLDVFRVRLRDTLADGQALPPFPDPHRGILWRRTLAAVEAGNRAADQAGADGTSAAALLAAERRYTMAQRSCRTLCAAYRSSAAIRRRLFPVVGRTVWPDDLG